MFKKLNHNHFALGLVAVIVVFLATLVAGDPSIPISELTGVALHRLALWTAYWVGMVAFLGGLGYDVISELKTHPLALGLLVAGVVVGSALVLSH